MNNNENIEYLETTYLCTRDLAQLLVYWLDEQQLPASMKEHLYLGMAEDLKLRGKTCQTDDDEQRMRARWLRLHMHAELDIARENRGDVFQDLPVDLEVTTVMAAAAASSITEETEKEATDILTVLNEEARSQCDDRGPGEQVQNPTRYHADEDVFVWPSNRHVLYFVSNYDLLPEPTCVVRS